ncbi:hypothetical protein AKJ61_02425, partial [candidate division MSBL1 archaeon SCGC-AAA259B11]
MPYAPFHEKFPRVAEEETRSIIAPSHSKLPKGKYVLVELFCDEPDCDCRRVFFDVFYEEKKKSVAVVAYGWEDREIVGVDGSGNYSEEFLLKSIQGRNEAKTSL